LNGYLTVVPDLWNGDPVQPSEFWAGKVDLQKWGSNHGTETTDPIINDVLEYLKKDLKFEHLAGVGYCLGAKVSRSQTSFYLKFAIDDPLITIIYSLLCET